jgi:hypothetical protein
MKESGPRIEIKYPDERKHRQSVRKHRQSVHLADRKSKHAEGSEMEVSRAGLQYETSARRVDGLVLKKIRMSESQPEWAEHHLRDMLR